MDIQIRMSVLSEWQKDREEEYVEAIRALKRCGIKAEYNMLHVSSEREEPGCIYLTN